MTRRIVPLAGWILLQQQLALGFLAPCCKRADTVLASSKEKNASLSSSGYKSFSAAFPSKKQKEVVVPQNDMSMFLAQESEEKVGFDALEFFMAQDESIQRLEAVEEFFRNEPQGIVMEEPRKDLPVVPLAKTTAKGARAKMTTNTGIFIDEEPPSKRFIHYNYEGTLTKIKSNLCNNPEKSYSE